MDYEKKYKEALARATKLHSEPTGGTERIVCEQIFPELMVSEDEKIRKELIAFLRSYDTFLTQRFIDWLEKQGEQKLNGTFVNVDDVREDFIDEVYRVLDADPTNDRANQIIDAFDNLPTVTIKQDPCEHCQMTQLNCYSFPCDEKREFEQGKTALEAINEEKVDNSNRVEPKDYNSIDPHFGKPTNKVEPKFKIKYAGSEYNVLEVKDIAGVTYYGIEDEPNHIDYVQAENCERVDGYNIKESGSPFPTKPAKFSEQNSTWSEEDEKKRNLLIDILNVNHPNGVFKVNPVNTSNMEAMHVEELISWLKSLKDKYTWKPSDEQMDALVYHLKHTNENSRLYKDTKKLYDQLKKLK